jgi:hypothetical protein
LVSHSIFPGVVAVTGPSAPHLPADFGHNRLALDQEIRELRAYHNGSHRSPTTRGGSECRPPAPPSASAPVRQRPRPPTCSSPSVPARCG